VRTGLIAVLLLCSLSCEAQETWWKKPGKKRWWASIAALAAASVLDAHSSWGRRELNPMLRGPDGRFGYNGVILKSSILGASCAFQWVLVNREPRLAGTLAGVNSGLAAWSTTAALRNRQH